MIYDSISDSLYYDWKKTLYLYSPVMFCLGCFFALSNLPCYLEQRGLMILMINYVLAMLCFNIMIHNMTGKSFSPLQPILIIPLIPLMAHYAELPQEI